MEMRAVGHVQRLRVKARTVEPAEELARAVVDEDPGQRDAKGGEGDIARARIGSRREGHRDQRARTFREWHLRGRAHRISRSVADSANDGADESLAEGRWRDSRGRNGPISCAA